MVTIQISLPDDLAHDAEILGLFESPMLEAIFQEKIREHTFDFLLGIAGKLRAAEIEPMSEEEIVAEVRATRSEQNEANT